jgi:tetratricopeptide (TPR) repeat protein
LTAQNIYGGYPKGINNLGLVYWKEGDKEKAREYFLKALSPEFPFYGAYENLALMDLEDGNYDEAKKWLLEFYSGNEKVADFYIAAYLENTGGGAK